VTPDSLIGHDGLVKKGSISTNSASGLSRIVKAALISRLVLALRSWISKPLVRAADCESFDVLSELGPAGLTSTATRVAKGRNSCTSPNRFASNSAPKKLMPVKFPPGRARLDTRPTLTGSSAKRKTMGIVVVAALAASAPLAWLSGRPVGEPDRLPTREAD
jgi:hypothetical protein